jgi:hypothetical protein
MPNGNDDIKKEEEGLPDSGLLNLIGRDTTPKKFGMSRTQPQSSEPAQQQEQTASADTGVQSEEIEFVKSDGSKAKAAYPQTEEERKQAYANYLSLQDTYEKGKEILKEKAPEVAEDWRGLLKQQTEILGKMADAQVQAQQNQPVNPVDLLSEKQRAEYNYRLESGDERGAQVYLDSAADVNFRIWQAEQKSVEAEKRVLEQKVNNKLMEFCQLDSSLPNPRRGEDGEAFRQKFQSGYGGYLKRLGFSDEQVWFSDNIDHETLYNAYLTKTGQSKQVDKTTTKETPVKTVKPANAAISPDVAKSIRDVAGGSISAPIGGENDGSRYKNVHGRAALRKLAAEDPKFMDDILKATGIGKFIPKRPPK